MKTILRTIPSPRRWTVLYALDGPFPDRRGRLQAVCIANDTSPAMYVLVDGTARVTRQDVDRVTHEMYVRYQGQERGSKNAEEDLASGDTVVLIVEPSRLVSWVSGTDG